MRFFKEVETGKVFLKDEITDDLKNYVEVIPNTTEAAVEKHVPLVEVNGNKVKVVIGETIHPMTEPHYIEWISLQTKNGYKKVELSHSDEPIAVFELEDGDVPIKAYEFCNLHGLWGKNI